LEVQFAATSSDKQFASRAVACGPRLVLQLAFLALFLKLGRRLAASRRGDAVPWSSGSVLDGAAIAALLKLEGCFSKGVLLIRININGDLRRRLRKRESFLFQLQLLAERTQHVVHRAKDLIVAARTVDQRFTGLVTRWRTDAVFAHPHNFNRDERDEYEDQENYEDLQDRLLLSLSKTLSVTR
jgi:hypothetical protein